MTIKLKYPTICVLTGRGIDTILQDGGSRAWVLDAKRAATCEYVVCVQNRAEIGDWGHASAPHHMAFVVGRLKGVDRAPAPDPQNRWILTFEEYAEITVPDAWPGYRNPVLYTDLQALKIDPETLEFHPMPEPAPVEVKAIPLTLTQAKQGLALTFGVDPSAIEITVRG